MNYTRLCVTALCLLSSSLFSADRPANLTPDEALKLLMDGNNRFVTKQIMHQNFALEAANLKEGQAPFATIIGCSDSRVPTEIIFDQGPGDLFVVRDAGNVIGPIELDSILYAVKKLKTPLVVVLGHEYCGAVGATLLGQDHVPELANIFPIIERAIKQCKQTQGDILTNAIKCNVKQGVQDLKARPKIAEMINAKQLKIVGAYFDFDERKVTLIE